MHLHATFSVYLESETDIEEGTHLHLLDSPTVFDCNRHAQLSLENGRRKASTVSFFVSEKEALVKKEDSSSTVAAVSKGIV